MMIISLLLAVVFLAISILHIYWAFGGKWGFEIALPTNAEGVKVFQPGFISCVMVGIALLLFSLFYLRTGEWINISVPGWIENNLGWIIPLLFLLRAVGDFKYIGLFKKIKETSFGRMDTYLYSPLSFFIGLCGSIVYKVNL
jgi:hypothetical protein